MEPLEFKESAVNPSLFIIRQVEITTYLFLYVDDIVIVGSDEEKVKGLIKKLVNEFPMRDLGELKFFLGVQVTYFEDGVRLSQTQYLINLLRSCEMENLKPAVTPMIVNLDLKSEETPINDRREF